MHYRKSWGWNSLEMQDLFLFASALSEDMH